MRLVPVITLSKKAFYEKTVAEGGEGAMLKLASGKYVQQGRPKEMYKAKRFEEVDAFVTGFDPAKEEKGWIGLVGNLRVSCYTETGALHEVAYPANLTLEDRIDATCCGKCNGKLDVKHDNVDGKRVVLDINCTECGAHRPIPALSKHWYGKVFEIRGQEWTARVYRLKHAFIERERKGVDGKDQKECTVNLKDIKHRFERVSVEAEID